MIRRPQKPLAHVIAARAEGEDPDINAAEARLIAARQRRRKEKFRNQIRLLMVCVAFVAGFGLVGGRMVMIASGDVARATAADLDARLTRRSACATTSASACNSSRKNVRR